VAPANVLQVPLPNAKDFKVYCLYGVGTPTERGYHYLKTRKQGPGGTVHTEWSVNPVADDPKSGLVRKRNHDLSCTVWVSRGQRRFRLVVPVSAVLSLHACLCGTIVCAGVELAVVVLNLLCLPLSHWPCMHLLYSTSPQHLSDHGF
jgi:hypothetical protein